MPRYTFNDLSQLSMSELRKIGRKFGLHLPKFGDMRSMINSVLNAQDNPKKFRGNADSKNKRSGSKIRKVGLSATELEYMSPNELRAYAKSLGLKSVSKFGSVKPLIHDILRAQDAGATPNKPLKSKEAKRNGSIATEIKIDYKTEPKAESNKKKSSEKKARQGKSRVELERMSRANLIAYGKSIGIKESYLASASTNTRLISDILLYLRDPKILEAQRRAKAKARADAVKARVSHNNIRQARKRGTSVTIKVNVQEIAESLKKVPLLAKLKKDILWLLANSSKAKRTSKGEPVFLEGEEGDGFYLVKSGNADVIVGKDTKVGALSAGDYFGEGALINKAPRGATVRATSPLVCLFWTKQNFMEIFTKIYGSRNLHTVFAKRHNVIATDDSKADHGRPVETKLYHKTEHEAEDIRKWIRKSPLLAHITSDDHFEAILRGFFKKSVKPGHTLVKEGEPGLILYVVQTGILSVTTKASGDVKSLHKGDLVGDLALLYDAPVSETITARTQSDLWCISRFTFRRLLKEVSEGELSRRCAFLAQTDLCRALSSFERFTIAEALEEVKYEEGDIVVRQGDEGDCMYFLKSGDVTAYVNGQEITWKNKELFGELALLSSAKRAATIKTTEPTVLLRLSKLAVETLLGPVKNFLEVRAKAYNRHSVVFPWGGTFGMRVFGTKVTKVEKGLQAHRLGVQVGWRVVEVNGTPVETFQEFQLAIDTGSENTLVFSGLGKKQIKMERKGYNFPWKLPQLTKMCILGKGSFGSVYLVKTPKKETFALKCVSKRIVLDTKQSKHIVSEKEVMQKMDHPFIIKLFATYKDSKCVYFVLELCLGGELFGLIQNRGGALSEDATRFYAASVISIFAYMHKLDIIYRDLKPENLLVDAQGFLKLVDFGFAKQISSKTFTLCGTPDYLAPEIIRGTGHGKGVDWWCLGIFVYELVASYAPFYSDTPKQTYRMICSSAPITFPPSFSKNLRHLLTGLLQRKPKDRLGVIRGGADSIKRHEWFKGFDWSMLDARKVKPPFLVPVKNRMDASNFDDYSDDEEPEDCGSKPTGRWEEYFG
mmetsp:Transcript_11940/g.17800  ORF Transcript_11940/g.17800 Transcript_11940/m.17800 type:complete len:1058 (+) Transcript_11940:168-3341(+)|eukprot:CAMPEP_0167770926 /NCGR_PEP_ID=MMETSP0110_2-20121227/18216_1 /TAXON_ID=629695 /ORGANISM="Gymnochlora sp., Strain CCMP2014" /LENGTH=1057 /DNA_ID=CAMNT_0007660209 /DNA_START=103 /DNA_END=3276 /DNA_ORIENTATION=-